MNIHMQQPELGVKDIPTRIALNILAIIAGTSYTFGPTSWHTGAIYTSLASIHVPIMIYGIVLILVGLVGFFSPKMKPRFIAYIVGGVVYMTFTILLIIHFHLFGGTVSASSIGTTGAIASWYWMSAYRSSFVSDRKGEVNE